MNRFFLYFPCLLALVFSSCEDDEGIGLTIQPDEDFMSTYSARVYCSAGTEKCDSVLAKSDYLYLGQYADDVFGITRAEFMTQIDGRLGNLQIPDTTVSNSNTVSGISIGILNSIDDHYGYISSIRNGRDVKVDSVVFYIQYSNSYVGDSTALQSIKLYELNKTLPSMNASFSNMKVEDYCDKSVLLGKATYRICGDKTIRIKLDDEYAQKLMDVYVNKTISTQEEFCDLYKGFYISHSFNEGAVITCSSVGLQVYYSFDGDIYTKYDGRDTVVTGRSITVNGRHINPLVSSFLLTANKGVNQVNLFSHPDLDEKLQNLKGLPYSYIFTPAGLYTNVTIPIKDVKDSIVKAVGAGNVSNVMFNSAKLKFPVEKINWKTYLSKTPNAYLMMIKRDKIVDFFYNNNGPDALESFVAVYDTASASYSFDIAFAAQQYLKGNEQVFDDLVLLPVTGMTAGSNVCYKQTLTTSALRFHSSDVKNEKKRPSLDFVYTQRK